MSVSIFSLLRAWRVALLLVAVACLSPGRAPAECGDYVTILNGPQSSTDHANPNSSHDATPDGSETRTPAKPPCHGPNCSGSPSREFPPVAPVVPIGTRAKELTQHLGLVGADADPGSAFDREPTSDRPIRRVISVFRPPRLG